MQTMLYILLSGLALEVLAPFLVSVVGVLRFAGWGENFVFTLAA